ncbi:hypothetical protein [Stigmatella aurantiaca]|uniref:Conserved uncharacterized protein n=1 Tax=Stigmatella aurantiaca (strain DW4/3-1) TaxID=378806 RepID=Q08WP8_STIAD|nr:hypothetical protein [Stigmatella aurantiaca]ADO73336.1 conserved uncharacterized protein [Stigmatella aurantiaca DW4/3-1]EAU64911.1 hypothetical protein STIAU_5454 [Stigmatella aurantiaca DW4/3-1]
MNRFAVVAALGLTAVGCSHTQTASQSLPPTEDGKCLLVHTLLREPVPAQYLEELASAGLDSAVPVMVFVRKPEEGVLERFFEGDTPACSDTAFRVVRQFAQRGLVLYLQETPEGYTYDARRSGPEELSMEGAPQGIVRRAAAGGWVAATD